MHLELNLDNVAARLKDLPTEADRLDDLPASSHGLYEEADGKFRLRAADRDHLLQAVGKMRDEDGLRAENKALREKADKQLVVDTVRGALQKAGVKPALMNAVFHEFMASHRFVVTEDGKVKVAGDVGAGDAEIAAVQWAHDQADGGYTGRIRKKASGLFTAEIDRLRGAH